MLKEVNNSKDKKLGMTKITIIAIAITLIIILNAFVESF